MLEMLKKLEFEQKMQETQEKLEKLAEKQEDLANNEEKSNEEKKEEQEKINEEFEELKAFVKESEFDHLGVFAYSVEENTDSYLLDGQLDEEEKESRRNEMMELQQSISKNRLRRNIGKSLEVLVEGPAEDTPYMWQARHTGQAPDIDGHVLIHSGEFHAGQLLRVEIEEALEYDLIGKPIDSSL